MLCNRNREFENMENHQEKFKEVLEDIQIVYYKKVANKGQWWKNEKQHYDIGLICELIPRIVKGEKLTRLEQTMKDFLVELNEEGNRQEHKLTYNKVMKQLEKNVFRKSPTVILSGAEIFMGR